MHGRSVGLQFAPAAQRQAASVRSAAPTRQAS